VEKRTKGVYVPIGGKKMLTFMDDFNMPAKDAYGSQPPLELIRLWLDYGFWYDRVRQTVRHIRVCFFFFFFFLFFFLSVEQSFHLPDLIVSCLKSLIVRSLYKFITHN